MTDEVKPPRVVTSRRRLVHWAPLLDVEVFIEVKYPVGTDEHKLEGLIADVADDVIDDVKGVSYGRGGS
jgi:hypothetical protein